MTLADLLLIWAARDRLYALRRKAPLTEAERDAIASWRAAERRAVDEERIMDVSGVSGSHHMRHPLPLTPVERVTQTRRWSQHR